VNEALKLRRLAYFCRESMSIVSDETLGIPKVDDASFPIYDQVPVPSVLDFQIDTMGILEMFQLLKPITGDLKKKFYNGKIKQHWYEIYLICFILLHTLETWYDLHAKYKSANEEEARHSILPVDGHSQCIQCASGKRQIRSHLLDHQTNDQGVGILCGQHHLPLPLRVASHVSFLPRME